MDEKSFSKCAGGPANGNVTATAGQSTVWGVHQAVTGEPRGLTLAAETTLDMARNLEELGENLETLGRILQALEQRL
jgi:pseudouridine-5'-phosphate glycosidase